MHYVAKNCKDGQFATPTFHIKGLLLAKNFYCFNRTPIKIGVDWLFSQCYDFPPTLPPTLQA